VGGAAGAARGGGRGGRLCPSTEPCQNPKFSLKKVVKENEINQAIIPKQQKDYTKFKCTTITNTTKLKYNNYEGVK
jgi:hypothetical protein